MTQIRHVPARPERRNGAIGTEIVFEAICEGDILTDGGTVETSYNEHGHPIERRVVDEEGTLLYRIDHTYDAKGRLAEERIVTQNFSVPKAFRDQIPSEQRAAVLAQIKTEMESTTQRIGLFGNAERTYVYDDHGNLVETHMHMGPLRLDLMWTRNDRGDMIELIRRTSGIPREFGGEAEMQWKSRYSYQYDDRGNWTSRSETSETTGDSRGATTQTQVRRLTYY